MSDTLHRIALHADSGRCHTVEVPTMTVDVSYLPGHVVITLFEPTRRIVVDIEQLVNALQSS